MQIVSVRRNLLRFHLISKLHVSSSQPRLGSRCLLYCYTMGSDLSQPTSTFYVQIFAHYPVFFTVNVQINAHNTSRLVPSAKEFLCVMCSFSIANKQSIPTKLEWSWLTYISPLVCYVCSCHGCFFHSGITIWPANLMCWNDLPVLEFNLACVITPQQFVISCVF